MILETFFQDLRAGGRVLLKEKGFCFLGVTVLANVFYRVIPYDPLIYSLVVLVLTAVAAASCFGPAQRATRVDPMVALRTE